MPQSANSPGSWERYASSRTSFANARVLDHSTLPSDTVQLLSKVALTNMGNQAKMTYTIVSPHEASLKEGKISVKSPIAKALMNRKKGDIVEIRVPAGLLKLRIDDFS